MSNTSDKDASERSENGIPEHLRKGAVADSAGAAGLEPNGIKPNAKPDRRKPKRSRAKPKAKSRQGTGGGPKTEEGKARAALNALKHGIYAMHPVVIADFESIDDWDGLYEGYREYFQPEGEPEEDLVYQLAATNWDAKRLIHGHTARLNEQVWKTESDLNFSDETRNLLTKKHEPGGVPLPEPERVLVHQQSRVVLDKDQADTRVRLEGHVQRTCERLLTRLISLQDRRLNRPTASVHFRYSSERSQDKDHGAA